MPKVIVLGAGMVGSVIARDLAENPSLEVAVADVRPHALAAAVRRSHGKVAPIQANLASPESVREVVDQFDVVCGALGSKLGAQTLAAVINAEKHYCDISFMPEDPLEFDELAKKRGVTAIVDCGVAPGMSNLLAGHGVAQLGRCDSLAIYVGGLPRERRWPFEYKAAFSPSDVIEEYTRPARLVEHGEIVTREALSEPESIDFEGVGTLEAFNTDGLRTLTHTLDVPFMKEKTMRYPGHAELMRILRATGLFSEEAIQVGEHRVRPLDVISTLMFPKWTYHPGEEDLTAMRVILEGERSAGDGAKARLQWDLLDRYDPTQQETSMSRTTAFPCSILAQMILSGDIKSTGVLPPELLVSQAGFVDKVLAEHERRGVHYTFTEVRL
jgi:saccharopine dehydrogenase-like NADP-dependent oxidoreductase